MKKLRKILALVLAMVMVLGMSTMTAFAQTVPEGAATAGTGSISIKNPTNGQTYRVYKLFDATVDTVDGTIAYTGTIPEALRGIFEVVPGTTKNIQVKSSAVDGDGAFTAAAVETITSYVNNSLDESTAVASATSDGTAPLTFQNLAYGYYAVTSSLGTVVTIDSDNPYVTVRDKNTENPATDADKKIVTAVAEDGTKTTASTSTAKIGDTVDYQVTFTAQNYDKDDEFVYQYVITDTPTGLSIVTDENGTPEFTVTIVKGTEKNQYPKKQAANATLVNGKLTITIPWGVQSTKTSYYDTPATVTVTYSAKLTATTGTNKANVTYNTKTTGKDTPETKVYTAEYDLTKVDKASKQDDGTYTKTLEGAEFALYDAQKDGKKIAVSQKTDAEGKAIDGAYIVDPEGTAKIVSPSNGKITIEGLKQGVKYYLEETKAPAGYSLPSERFTLTAATVSTTQNQTVEANIENSTAGELPSTGGMGTTLFYVFGAVLVIGAGIVLVTRRRMAK